MFSLYAGAIESPQIVARGGDAAPGVGAGVSYVSFAYERLNDTGQVAYTAALSGTGVTSANNEALYAGDAGSPTLVARKGDAAPEVPAGVKYSILAGPQLAAGGQVAYRVVLTGTGVTSANNAAIYSGDVTNPQLVARKGNPAAGAPSGTRYSALGTPVLNNLGQISYLAWLGGTGVTSANDGVVYAGSPATPQIVAREGSPAPGTAPGVSYAEFSAQIPSNIAKLSDAGHITYTALLEGPDVTGFNDFALYAGEFANPRLIAREGDEAPGTGPGVTYRFGGDVTINDAGQVAYSFFLSGTDVTSVNDRGVFAFDPVLGNMLIAREGDLFDVGGGDVRTIADGGVALGFQQAGGAPLTGLADDGRVAFRLRFTDGTSGVFTAVIPEPGTFLSLVFVPIFLQFRGHPSPVVLQNDRITPPHAAASRTARRPWATSLARLMPW
jgi:hypothetical protein